MISQAHARAVLMGLQELKANGAVGDWIDLRIAEYSKQLAVILLEPQAEPFVPYPDTDGVMIINAEGDREDDA
ncbi:hypothetical protein LVY75_04460 (plasmid) [Sinorhizobium sp. B11]